MNDFVLFYIITILCALSGLCLLVMMYLARLSRKVDYLIDHLTVPLALAYLDRHFRKQRNKEALMMIHALMAQANQSPSRRRKGPDA